MAVNESQGRYAHPLYDSLLRVPGLSVAVTSLDRLLGWGTENALWVFPMATSCCGIELMATAASRVDVDRMGTIVRATPRQADVMVVAGTITVKMAPRVLRLWEQMPEPKWCIAMGSCAISGDFYRELRPTIPGIDTFLPVDIYVPGCPPNPESLMQGLLRLQEKIRAEREGKATPVERRPELLASTLPSIGRVGDPGREATTRAQLEAAAHIEPMPEPPLDVMAPGPVTTRHGCIAIDVTRFEGEPTKEGPLLVPVQEHVPTAMALQARGYAQLAYLVAAHYPKKDEPGADGAEAFELVVGVRRPGRGGGLAQWRVRVPTQEPVPSLYEVYAGADWQEREQFDLVGVRFAGHPDLRRLLLPDDWPDHPLKKSSPMSGPLAPWR